MYPSTKNSDDLPMTFLLKIELPRNLKISVATRRFHPDERDFNRVDKTVRRRCSSSKKTTKSSNDSQNVKAVIKTTLRRPRLQPTTSKIRSRRPPTSKDRRRHWKRHQSRQCRQCRRCRTSFKAVRQINRSPLTLFRIGRKRNRKKSDSSSACIRRNKMSICDD